MHPIESSLINTAVSRDNDALLQNKKKPYMLFFLKKMAEQPKEYSFQNIAIKYFHNVNVG